MDPAASTSHYCRWLLLVGDQRYVMYNSKNPASRHPLVLLVEDNDNDVELTKLAFKSANAAVDLRCVADGEQCMNHLYNAAEKGDSLPDLILLDLHMTRMDGLEVLKAISQAEALCHIPVVVLTTSDAPDDIDAAYRLRCNSYIVKPMGFEAFAKIIAELARYWFEIVSLPMARKISRSAEQSIVTP